MQRRRSAAHQLMKEVRDKKVQRRNTLILALILAVIFGAGLVFLRMTRVSSGLYAVIEQGGSEVGRLPLSEDTVLNVPFGGTGYNLVEVRDGTVSVKEADCRNQICVGTGAIRYPGEVIACIPHRVIITISEKESKDP